MPNTCLAQSKSCYTEYCTRTFHGHVSLQWECLLDRQTFTDSCIAFDMSSIPKQRRQVRRLAKEGKLSGPKEGRAFVKISCLQMIFKIISMLYCLLMPRLNTFEYATTVYILTIELLVNHETYKVFLWITVFLLLTSFAFSILEKRFLHCNKQEQTSTDLKR